MSALPQPAQAADAELRKLGYADPQLLRIDGTQVEFDCAGDRVTVSLEHVVQVPSRPESCGKEPKDPLAWVVTAITG